LIKSKSLCKPRLVLRLYGGLGNQLFSYAAALCLAKKNNIPLYLDTYSGFFRDRVYKRKYRLSNFSISAKRSVSWEVLGVIYSYLHPLFSYINKRNAFHKRFMIVQDFIEYDARLQKIEIKSPRIIEGFWQSEKYFFDFIDVIRCEFSFHESFINQINQHIPHVNFMKGVALHVRNFQDAHHSNLGNVQSVYYKKAIQYFKDKIIDPHFYLFSDNPALALRRCDFADGQFTIVSNLNLPEGELGELYFMSLFKHFIISNSTYSWWGAWLSRDADKIVVAPSEKIDSGEGLWGFDGLLPDDWIKM